MEQNYPESLRNFSLSLFQKFIKRVPPNFHFIIHHYYAHLKFVRIFPTFFPHNASFSVRLSTIHELHARKKASRFLGEKAKSGKVGSERFDYRSVTFRWLIGENGIGQLEAANVAKEAIGHTCGTITPAFACEPKNVTLLSQRRSNFRAELPPHRRIELFAYDSYNRGVSRNFCGFPSRESDSGWKIIYLQ